MAEATADRFNKLIGMLIFILPILAIGIVFSVGWWRMRQEPKPPRDIDAEVERELNSDGKEGYFAASPLGWFLFLFNGRPTWILVLAVLLSAYTVYIAIDANSFSKNCVSTLASFPDAANTPAFLDNHRPRIRFKPEDGLTVETTLEYSFTPSLDQRDISILYLRQNPKIAKLPEDVHGPTHMMVVITAITWFFGIYRWCAFRPRAPIRDWRSEI
jgi:hypothetical protein